MDVQVLDPQTEPKFRDSPVERESRFEEVWEGVVVMPPMPNNEHQDIQFKLLLPIAAAVEVPGIGCITAGVNISDRDDQWGHNFRGPDVVVYLNTNPAINHGTHWQGGPDFLAEIISPGEKPYAKFEFYAKVNTREVLIVKRDPWIIELFQLKDGVLELAGRSDTEQPTILVSSVLALTFQLVAGRVRPQIEVTHPPSGKTWLA